jgi:hypothetical protein
VRRLGLGLISSLFETLARLEQVARHIRIPDVCAEAIDEAIALHDGAARFPKRTAFPRTQLAQTLSMQAKSAVLGFGLVHV